MKEAERKTKFESIKRPWSWYRRGSLRHREGTIRGCEWDLGREVRWKGLAVVSPLTSGFVEFSPAGSKDVSLCVFPIKNNSISDCNNNPK